MIRAENRQPPLLGRPFSVYDFYHDKKALALELLYRVVGQGTRIFSLLPQGEKLEILGPLGRGFKIDGRRRKLILIAGGMGVAPLSFLASYVRRRGAGSSFEIVSYVGARTASYLAGLDKLETMCSKTFISTDDGSLGYHGKVIELFEDHLKTCHGDMPAVYTCGPYPMIRQLADILRGCSGFCQVSMEERMACGIGACLGCAIPIRNKDNRQLYKRVCKDGPVFDIRDLAWR
jgi:dihydroorotate dehydrogenase electron transfer subunit